LGVSGIVTSVTDGELRSSETPLRRALAIQARVLRALVLREVLTRYGRHNIGFLWLFVEPMLFTLGVTGVWSLTKSAHSTATPIIPFALTGYSSVLLWRNAANRCPKAVESNLSLLYHRNVKVLDVFLARLVLEIAGTTMSFAFLTCFFGGLELAPWPADVVGLAAAWLALAGFATGLGLILGALSEQTEVVDRVWHTVTYLIFPFSGAVFMVDWLPTRAQQILLTLPMVHATEWIRHAYFGDAVRTYEDPLYLLAWDLVLVLVGLSMTERAERRIEPE
jgi:capsular polysaccharide transport system permease protein